MADSEYKLRYLPLFYRDLTEVASYIRYVLNNESAAQRLIDDTEKAILERVKSPLSFSPYRSVKNRKNEYYRINVRNYAVFYVVIGDVMEVRRFLYAKRNIDDLL